MERLPSDTVQLVSSFLTSHDAFHLSHANSWWLRYVGDGLKWQKRLLEAPAKELSRGWNKKSMVTPSLLFQGRHTDNNLLLDSFAYLVDNKRKHFHLTQLRDQSFSFDVWFSLLPASDSKCLGGIIFGLQSASRESRPWPHYHQPIVVVNSVGDLYCSVLDAKPVVARNLQSNCWYHLALSYDVHLHRQEVYLDGVTTQSDDGALHQEWSFLSHEQVGTGCVTGADDGFPYRGYLGWYGFHGLVDEFRVWSGVFSHDEVDLLAHGGRIPGRKPLGSMKFANGSGVSPPRVNVQVVPCTRPTERETVSLELEHRLG